MAIESKRQLSIWTQRWTDTPEKSGSADPSPCSQVRPLGRKTPIWLVLKNATLRGYMDATLICRPSHGSAFRRCSKRRAYG
jgi:hypothetical protein